MVISYPSHSTHCGSLIIRKEYRHKGYVALMLKHFSKTIDQTFTIGLDSLPYMIPFFESFGFCTVWENSIAMLSFEKIISKLDHLEFKSEDLLLKPIRTVDIKMLVSVFGWRSQQQHSYLLPSEWADQSNPVLSIWHVASLPYIALDYMHLHCVYMQ